MKGKLRTRKVRRSVALSHHLIEEVKAAAPPELRENLNRLVTVALQEFAAKRKERTFEEAMARMAAFFLVRFASSTGFEDSSGKRPTGSGAGATDTSLDACFRRSPDIPALLAFAGRSLPRFLEFLSLIRRTGVSCLLPPPRAVCVFNGERDEREGNRAWADDVAVGGARRLAGDVDRTTSLGDNDQ